MIPLCLLCPTECLHYVGLASDSDTSKSVLVSHTATVFCHCVQCAQLSPPSHLVTVTVLVPEVVYAGTTMLTCDFGLVGLTGHCGRPGV